MEVTGERFMPDYPGDWSPEHYHRYFLARELVEGKRVLDIASGEGYGSAILAQLGTAAKRAGGKYRREKNRERLHSGEMDQIKVPYSAGGSQALGIASAQQRLLAAILREPRYLELAKQQLTAEQFIQPQQKELYEAMLNCSREGVELSLTALRAFVSEEALNELSRLAAQYSDVNCTPEDIHLYLDRIARGMPVASKAAAMSGDEITQYLQSMREKKQGTLPEQD